ncbi:Fic/DOC family protein [Arthrobacter sp. SA17]
MPTFDDPYCYPGTEVLKNKQVLRDSQHALEIEREYSLLRRRELELNPVQGTFGLAHLQEIHRRLYQDVWDWAGQLRTVEITKGDSHFLQTHFFRNAGVDLSKFLQSTELLTNPDITDEDFIAQAADLLEKVNYIHPFREGNGRAQRAYLDQIAELSGRTFAWRNISKLDNERASIRAFKKGCGEPFRVLLEQALEPPMDGLSILDDELYQVSSPIAGASPPT